MQAISPTPTPCQICLSHSEGGLESMSVEFAKLCSSKHESHSICIDKTQIHSSLETHGLKNLALPKSLNFFLKLKLVHSYIRRNQISHLVIHRFKDLKFTFWIKLLNPKLKIIAIAHIFIDHKKKDPLHRLVYSQISLILTLTEIQKKSCLKTLPISEGKYEILNLGIPVDRFLNPPSIRLKGSVPEILCVGRFDPQKGQWELLQAAHQLIKEGLPLKLCFVGNDTYGEPGTKEKCLNYIASNNLSDYVEIRSYDPNIHETYKTFDIFVMPSHKETFGLVMLEAMAAGCQIISTKAGGPIEILNKGELGLLADPKSVASLAENIKFAINNYESLYLMRKKAQNEVQTKYTQTLMAEKFNTLCLN